MSIYTQKFSCEEDYERWISRAGARINVLTIQSGTPRIIRGRLERIERPVMVRYSTQIRELAPQRQPRPLNRRRGKLTDQQWKLAPVFTFGALLAALAAYAVR
jgi:hypothetical protein